jgi:hypothetical protein
MRVDTMVKLIGLLLIAALSLTATVVLENPLVEDLNFEDQAFAYCITSPINSNPLTRAKDIRSLECDARYITSVAGIEQFPKLEKLSLRANQLTSLDLTSNPKLITLYAHDNVLTHLNISANTKLETLFISDNQLTSLNTSTNIALDYINADNNKLGELDLSKNTALTHLSANNNALDSIDLTANTVLNDIDLAKNHLTTLNFTLNKALHRLDVSHNQLTDLDVSNHENLRSLRASHNQLSTFRLKDLSVFDSVDIRRNPFSNETRDYLKTLNLVIPTHRWPYETPFSFQWEDYSFGW